MEITVKLMGLLKDRTPVDGRLELSDGATIEAALQALQIAALPTFMISVNGQLERNRARVLLCDDLLTVLPPVGGG
ncbi:MAG: MoaD/ThiS family protein [Planctomycetota bacterium]|nr:MoaD/ThiS family protein [Planctomycetota bacterium]MDA1177366.1 MoaD/ThiS family protein [Planctomycetota bacterium]